MGLRRHSNFLWSEAYDLAAQLASDVGIPVAGRGRGREGAQVLLADLVIAYKRQVRDGWMTEARIQDLGNRLREVQRLVGKSLMWQARADHADGIRCATSPTPADVVWHVPGACA